MRLKLYIAEAVAIIAISANSHVSFFTVKKRENLAAASVFKFNAMF
jgi:hypothetical protein